MRGGSGQSLTARPRLLTGNPLPQRWQPRCCHLQRPSWLLSWLPSWLLLFFTAVPSGFKNTEEIRARGTVERPPNPLNPDQLPSGNRGGCRGRVRQQLLKRHSQEPPSSKNGICRVLAKSPGACDTSLGSNPGESLRAPPQ